jgi:hypothetical protein
MTDFFQHEPTCSFESHRWVLDIEDGHASIDCLDPCEDVFDPDGLIPVCLAGVEPEEIFAQIPVTVTYVDDSTPSSIDGPAEYGFYLEVRPVAEEEPNL